MWRNYLVLAFKVLVRRPFFTFVSLFGICLTLLVLMLGVAFLDHTFAAMPPESRADRLLGVFQIELEGEQHQYRGEAGYSVLDRHVRNLAGAEEVSLATIGQPAVTFAKGQKVVLEMRRVDGAFFRILDFEFLEGAPFSDQDDAEARPVAVISRDARRRVFGDSPAYDRVLEFEGKRYRVVGVVENVPTFRRVSSAGVFLPISSAPTDAYKRGAMGRFQALILAPSRADLPALRAEALRRLAEVDLTAEGDYERLVARVETPFEAISRELLGLWEEDETFSPGARMKLLILVGVLLFMVLPSLNLINLNISRILERASEIGVRKSFGASSRALILQFVVENLVLTSIGGILGLGLAAVALHLVSGSELVSYSEVTMNFRVFGWGFLLTVFFGILSGVYPAWRMSRLHPKRALEESPS